MVGDRMKSKASIILAILVFLGMAISAYTLYYMINNQENISLRLDQGLNDIFKQKPLDGKNATNEQIAMAVADYCTRNNYCTGSQGPEGKTIVGPRGDQGETGTGVTGPKGEQGDMGPQGRSLEERCVVVNSTKRRIEQKYTDSETWQVKYYLSPGQLCPEEVQ
jgi:hypothetical protein